MTLAESDVTLALYVGESFAEAQLIQNQKIFQFHRWYLGKESLKAGLLKFLSEAGSHPLKKAVVASRFPEKIFSYRMGGSVAILCTKGFENWAKSRQPTHCSAPSLSSSELIFSVDERVSATGEISQEVSPDEISELIEKLKLKQAKRVCVHFLNAAQNPANQEKVKFLLCEAGFEVFTPDLETQGQDEVALWRKNVLNASLSGTFEEIQSEIQTALAPFLPGDSRPLFLSGDGHLFDKEYQHRLCSLWGASYAWARSLSARYQDSDLIYFGLEQFCLFAPDQIHSHWDSPWGRVFNEHVASRLLGLQPTTAIELSPWNELIFSKNNIGYEPGPMFLGRGQTPTFLDLWAQETTGIKGLDERFSSPGLQKFKNQIWALNKSTGAPVDSEVKVISRLKKTALQRLAAEILATSTRGRLICFGALAPLFAPQLQPYLSDFEINILSETETSFFVSEGT